MEQLLKWLGSRARFPSPCLQRAGPANLGEANSVRGEPPKPPRAPHGGAHSLKAHSTPVPSCPATSAAWGSRETKRGGYGEPEPRCTELYKSKEPKSSRAATLQTAVTPQRGARALLSRGTARNSSRNSSPAAAGYSGS